MALLDFQNCFNLAFPEKSFPAAGRIAVMRSNTHKERLPCNTCAV